VVIGSYRGFDMELHYDSFQQDMILTLKSTMRHNVTLGIDARGNVQRLDNALSSIPQRIENAQNQLYNLRQQQTAAEIEVTKPFPQEEELAQKSARLAELDALLNMDEKERAGAEKSEPEENSMKPDSPERNSQNVSPPTHSDRHEEVL